MKSRLEDLRGHLAAVEHKLTEETDPARLAVLADDAYRLRTAIAELEGRSLTGVGWKRP